MAFRVVWCVVRADVISRILVGLYFVRLGFSCRKLNPSGWNLYSRKIITQSTFVSGSDRSKRLTGLLLEEK